jgi:uncharacterized protein YndB with AHSA1/START domain
VSNPVPVSAEHAEPVEIALIVRRTIRASAQRVFQAWTRPEELRKWWGPKLTKCMDAEVDLRVGGTYRIANQFPDGRVVWISGEFERIEAPHQLVYTWRIGQEQNPETLERVTVRFEPREGATEVIVIHERIANRATRDGHQQGWDGCLDGLFRFLSAGVDV